MKLQTNYLQLWMYNIFFFSFMDYNLITFHLLNLGHPILCALVRRNVKVITKK